MKNNRKKLGKTEKSTTSKKVESITISPPNFKVGVFTIRGTSMLVQNKFSAKAKEQIRITQEAGQAGKKGKKKEGKDFKSLFEGAKHKSVEGWCGIPAPAVRNAMVSACKICGFKMTRAKLSVFAEADGFDVDDGIPLIKITKGKPIPFDINKLDTVRNKTGVIDLRARPKWEPGWEAVIKIRFDADQFTLEDVTNLLIRVGLQVGIGEGRPDSKDSCGMGWGLFEVIVKK